MNLKEFVVEQRAALGDEYVQAQLANLIDTLHTYQAVHVSPELFVTRCAFGWDAEEVMDVMGNTPVLRVGVGNLSRSRIPRPSLILPYPPIARDAFWAYVGMPAPTPTPTP